MMQNVQMRKAEADVNNEMTNHLPSVAPHTLIKTPTTYFITSGTSEGFTTLNAFDGALMAAGIGNTNLLRMSSICPPHTRQVGSMNLPHGALVPVAYASITSDKPGQTIAAGVAICFPEDEDHAGLIMEYSAPDSTAKVEAKVRRMAEEGMKMRGKKIREIKSAAAEHLVKECGAAFAAVVLWN
ncbi:MAG: arginine decarboxylase, pyruvoyl-dependent [Syntrophaceae bacterium]